MMFFPVKVNGRTIAHVTGMTYADALRDFRMSQASGWYPRNAVLCAGAA